MKFGLNFVFFICSVISVKAQNDEFLPVDELGKFIYYEVVELKALSKDSLKTKIFQFFKRKDDLVVYKSAQGDTAFSASGKFVISKTLLAMSHPSGEIIFRFEIEIKDRKYRFWLTDFVFIPYQRDRYGNFVPSNPIGTALESTPGKLDAAQWKAYQAQTATYAKALGNKFKAFMATNAPAVASAKEKKVIKKDW